jgi:hypothetical protein
MPSISQRKLVPGSAKKRGQSTAGTVKAKGGPAAGQPVKMAKGKSTGSGPVLGNGSIADVFRYE